MVRQETTHPPVQPAMKHDIFYPEQIILDQHFDIVMINLCNTYLTCYIMTKNFRFSLWRTTLTIPLQQLLRETSTCQLQWLLISFAWLLHLGLHLLSLNLMSLGWTQRKSMPQIQCSALFSTEIVSALQCFTCNQTPHHQCI